ncbi:MAG TPA: serine hydrolase domain-containing protein [Dongiaceae bacterium]|nr:serine hydrolase domain-containing protein [Dongiaceae bacterium]
MNHRRWDQTCRVFWHARTNSAFAIAGLLLLSIAGCGGGGSRQALPVFYPADAQVPITGPNAAGTAAFDTAVPALLKKWNVPGAAIAVAKDGKLLLARGYGYADFENQQQMQPDTMMRIGSISKVLTSMAVLHLHDQGMLDLDRPFLQILTQYQVPSGGDARLNSVTIRQLLHHSGGWDRNIKGDPLDFQKTIADALQISTPVLCPDVIRYQMSQPLDFAPGTKFVYSNFGYCILGQVVEVVSGQPLELYIRNNVLETMDVHGMSIGYSHLAQRGPREARYYDYIGAPLVDSVFPGEGKVPMSYGSFEMMTFCASGGWIGSAIDLTRIMTAIDGSRMAQFLSAETMTQWEQNPQLPSWASDGTWYGLGIFVHPSPRWWYHGGSLPGGQAMLFRNDKGYVWTIIANSRTNDPDTFSTDLNNAMTGALGNGIDGAAGDLYAQFPSPNLPSRTH